MPSFSGRSWSPVTKFPPHMISGCRANWFGTHTLTDVAPSRRRSMISPLHLPSARRKKAPQRSNRGATGAPEEEALAVKPLLSLFFIFLPSLIQSLSPPRPFLSPPPRFLQITPRPRAATACLSTGKEEGKGEREREAVNPKPPENDPTCLVLVRINVHKSYSRPSVVLTVRSGKI